jgi:CDP-paratose 2-epimerase
MEDVCVVEKEKSYDYKKLENGISEDRNLDFHSPYGCSKGCADQYVHDYSRIYGLKSVAFRMSCIYGTRQFGNEDQGWVAHFVISSVLGRPLTIYGDGKQVRDILFIDDLVDAFCLAIKNIERTKGQIYNIGGGKKNIISLLKLIEYLEEISGGIIEYTFDDWRAGDQKVYYSNIDKSKKDFGWQPKISKKEGIKRLYDWVCENRNLFGD